MFSAFVVGWIAITGSLFTFACDSPFNRSKEECKVHQQEKEAYFNKVWLGK